MRKNTTKGKKGPETGSDPLTEFLREKARTLLQIAVEAEMEEFLQAWVGVRNLEGKRTVVRNGYNPERMIQTGIGELSVRMPKVRDRSQNGVVFHSSLIPPYIRKTRSLEELIPLLYLKGVFTGQMQEALGALVGGGGPRGFSSAVVSRLKAKWTKEYEEFRKRPLEGEWLYLWVDGIYSKAEGVGQALSSDGDGSEQSRGEEDPGDRGRI